MLKKDQEFKWSEESKRAFQEIKEAIVAALVLVSPNYSKEFQMFSFALEDTITVLLQKNEQI
jgi:hypothetical protein